MAKHLKETKTSIQVLLVVFFVLCCIVFLVIKFFPQTLKQFSQKSFVAKKDIHKKEENIISKSDIHPFSNASHLHSQDFSLTVEDGISTLNATIVNNSDESVTDLKCIYSLMDSSKNIVYSFDISINNIESNNSSSFACMSILDLSNVVDYSVDLIEQ